MDVSVSVGCVLDLWCRCVLLGLVKQGGHQDGFGGERIEIAGLEKPNLE